MEILAQLREALPEFGARGVRVVCIVQGTPEEMERFCGRHGVAQICAADPSRASYRAMGLERTSWWRMLFAPEALKRRRKEARDSGCSVSLAGTFQKHSDILQLPGAALIGKGGRILWLHSGSHPGDLPSARELLAVIGERR